MKTIGVLGGIGPQATMDFEARLHLACQREIPPRFNSGYPPMVVWYLRHPPLVVDKLGIPLEPKRPDPRLLDAAAKLGAVVDLLAVPCNGAHLFRDQIERASGRSVVSMVDATLDEIRRRDWRRVGVLGMGEPIVYTRPLAASGIEIATIDLPHRDELDMALRSVMEGRNAAAEAATARRAVESLRSRHVDGIVLGCTELPFLLGDSAQEPDLLDPMDWLVEAVVRNAR